MKTFFKFARLNNSLFGFICLFVSVGLIIAGFCCPPLGIIDNSVLISIGLLLGFYVIHDIPLIVKTIKDTNASIKLQHGDSSIEISSSDNNETTE